MSIHNYSTLHNLFKDLKTSGFNFEDTHLPDIECFRKLLALVPIVFVWIYKAGIYLDGLYLLKIMGKRLKACSNID